MSDNTHSLELDGTANQRAEISDAAQNGALDITGALTMEMWVYPRTWPASGVAQIRKFSAAGGDRSYELIVAENSVNIQTSANGTAISDAYYLLTIPDSVWTHVAAVFDPAAGAGLENRFRLLVDGVLLGPLETSGSDITTLFNGAAPFFVGAGAAGFDGFIDDVRVWNVARSTAAIAAWRHVRLNGDEAGLKGLWRFDNDYADATENGNDLADVGGSVFATEHPFLYALPRSDIAGLRAPDPPGGIGLLAESRTPRVIAGDAGGISNPSGGG